MSNSDHSDRLGLDRFDAVAVPDQWADIVERAESADTNVVAMRRGSGWYLAAAASFVALIGGLVVVMQLRGDDGATPIDQPSTEAAGDDECTTGTELDAIVELLSSGMPLYGYDPAADVAELVGGNDVVVRAELTRAVRADGSAPADLGDLGLTTVSLSAVEVLSGERSSIVGGFDTASQWSVRSEPDPLGDPVTFARLEVIAFLSSHEDLPSGWTPDIEGWFVACDRGPAVGVIETPTFLDLSSLDALEAQITGIEPTTTPNTNATTTPTTAPTDPPSTNPTTTPSTPPSTVDEPQTVVDERWTPACAGLRGTTAATASDTGLDRLGPLGAQPGLDISLPEYRAPGTADAAAVNVVVGRVDGGVAVLARPYEGDDVNASVLTVVDDDGAIRWRRCLDGGFAGSMLTAPGATVVTVSEYGFDDVGGLPTGLPTWRSFDLGTGEDREPLAVPEGFDAYSTDGPFVVFGPSGDRITTADDQLAVLALRTGELTMIPFPPSLGVPAFRHQFEVLDDGGDAFRVLQRIDVGQMALSAIWTDGAWRSDEATILEAVGVTAVNTFDERGWEGRDALGAVVWSRPDLLDIRQEGFLSAVSDTVTVINGCLEQGEGGCVRGNLVGIDTSTGDTLWERSGLRGVSAVGDGYAIITNDAGDGWEMIDTVTGELVDESQQWADRATFAQECCGAGDFVYVGRDGGIVFAVDQDHVRVWYPQGRSDATIDVALIE